MAGVLCTTPGPSCHVAVNASELGRVLNWRVCCSPSVAPAVCSCWAGEPLVFHLAPPSDAALTPHVKYLKPIAQHNIQGDSSRQSGAERPRLWVLGSRGARVKAATWAGRKGISTDRLQAKHLEQYKTSWCSHGVLQQLRRHPIRRGALLSGGGSRGDISVAVAWRIQAHASQVLQV